jgi:putative H(+)-transporting two-sector ATPase subunit H.a
MDKIIDRLSDIEKAAGSLMDDAGVRKKALAKEMEEKTAAFDAQLEKENQDRISQIRSKMEEELQQELRQQSEDAKATMKRLEATYENRHEEYAQALFKNMIKE